MHQVRYFLAVATELNFTRASETCHVSQPSLTRAIKLLEEELGGPLFHRERANTHLTELGLMVRPHLQAMYDESRATKRLAGLHPAEETVLRSASCAPSRRRSGRADRLIHTRYRASAVDRRCRRQELNRRLLRRLEIAVYCLPAESDDARMHTMPPFREQMMIMPPASHPLAEKTPSAEGSQRRQLSQPSQLRVQWLCR
jgi:DNA-binding transcriptional LysR family regulator